MRVPHGARAAAFFLGVAVLLFPRVLTGHSFFHYDTWMQNLAFRAWWFAQLKAGHFATWCPGMFAGYPLFAETQTGPLYPPTFGLFLLLPPTVAFSWNVLLHFAWAGLGAWYLSRRLGASAAAAVLAGVAYELSGFLVTHVVHFNLLTGAAWAPWAVAFAWESWRGSARHGLAFAFAVAMLLLGAHPYATLMTLLLVALALAARSGLRPMALGRGAAVSATAVLAGVALAAVQVLPTRDLLARTPRGDAVDWGFLTFGSYPPWHLPALVAPDLFGTPVDGSFWGGPDWSHFAETCAYVGVLTLALAVVAVVLRRDRVTLFLGGSAALAIVLMLGKYTPAYRVLSWIPVLQSTRLPARFALVFTVAVAVLAALGLDALRAEEARRRRRALLVAGAVVIALSGAAWWAGTEACSPGPAIADTGRMWTGELEVIRAAAAHSAGRLAVLLAASLAALAPFAWRRVPRLAAWLPVIVLGADLFTWGRAFNPLIPGRWILDPPPVVAALPETLPRPRVFRQGVDELWTRVPGAPRADLFTPAWRGNEAGYRSGAWTLTPNTQLLYGVDSGEGFTSLLPSQWLEWMGLPDRPGATPRPDLTEAQADLLGIDAVLSTGSGIAGDGWETQAVDGDVWVSRNLDPLPRVRLARSWDTVPDRAELLRRIRDDAYDPRAAVLLEAEPAGLPGRTRHGPVDDALPATETGPGRWEIDVPPSGDALVVVAESYDPDWVARDETGESLPVFRADGLFTAFVAPVTGGTVVLRHAPRSVRAGALISVLAVLLLAGAAVVARRRALPAVPEPPAGGTRPWVPVAAAGLLVAVSVGANVGDIREDRDAAGLRARAARAWADEAFAARQAGAPDAALHLLESAAALRPRDASIPYRVGLIERERGRTEAAAAAFRRALEIDPGSDAARSALTALQTGAAE